MAVIQRRTPLIVTAVAAGLFVVLAFVARDWAGSGGESADGGQLMPLEDVPGGPATPEGSGEKLPELLDHARSETPVPATAAAAGADAKERLRDAAPGRHVGEVTCERTTIGDFDQKMRPALKADASLGHVVAADHRDLPRDLAVWSCVADVDGHGPSTALLPAEHPPRDITLMFVGVAAP